MVNLFQNAFGEPCADKGLFYISVNDLLNFKFLKGNRICFLADASSISTKKEKEDLKKRVEKLKKSIKKNGYVDIDPIIAIRLHDGSFALYDGQGRVQALFELNRENPEILAELVANGKWDGKITVVFDAKTPYEIAIERVSEDNNTSNKKSWGPCDHLHSIVQQNPTKKNLEIYSKVVAAMDTYYSDSSDKEKTKLPVNAIYLAMFGDNGLSKKKAKSTLDKGLRPNYEEDLELFKWFNSILRRKGVNPKDVKVIRHFNSVYKQLELLKNHAEDVLRDLYEKLTVDDTIKLNGYSNHAASYYSQLCTYINDPKYVNGEYKVSGLRRLGDSMTEAIHTKLISKKK